MTGNTPRDFKFARDLAYIPFELAKRFSLWPCFKVGFDEINYHSLFMSFASDARRRPNIWSYISFGSPRRQSSSLPRPNGQDLQDKEDGLRRTLWNNGQIPPSPGHNDAWMTGGQRSRLLKLGGLLATVIFLFYLFTSRGSIGTGGVQDVVKGNAVSISTDVLRRG